MPKPFRFCTKLLWVQGALGQHETKHVTSKIESRILPKLLQATSRGSCIHFGILQSDKHSCMASCHVCFFFRTDKCLNSLAPDLARYLGRKTTFKNEMCRIRKVKSWSYLEILAISSSRSMLYMKEDFVAKHNAQPTHATELRMTREPHEAWTLQTWFTCDCMTACSWWGLYVL